MDRLTPEEIIQAAAKQQAGNNKRRFISSSGNTNDAARMPDTIEQAPKEEEYDPEVPFPPNLQRAGARPGAYRIQSGGVVPVSRRSDEPHEETIHQVSSSFDGNTSEEDCENEEENAGDRRRRRRRDSENQSEQAQVTTIEAELVTTNDDVVVKAEPMQGYINKFRTTLFLFLVLFILLALIISLTIPRIRNAFHSETKFVHEKFPYYTHHSVVFGSHDASLQDVRVTLDCGNDGAVAKKDVNGPCRDDDDGQIHCALGNIVGDYNRHIFFSCGSHTKMEAPVTSAVASTESGNGIWYLSLVQLCQDESTSAPPSLNTILYHHDSSTCSGETQDLGQFSVCYGQDDSLSVEFTGSSSCTAPEPFVPPASQAEFVSRRDDIISKWLEGFQ